MFYYVIDILATMFEFFCLALLLSNIVDYKNRLGKVFCIYGFAVVWVFGMTFLSVPYLLKMVLEVISWKVFRMQQRHFLFNQFSFLRRHGNAQHNLSGSVYHASPSFPFKGFGDFPNKQNGRGPAGAGRAVFSGVWLHSLCLLRYCFSANKTFPNAKTTRKIDRWTEKSAKKEGACASP